MKTEIDYSDIEKLGTVERPPKTPNLDDIINDVLSIMDEFGFTSPHPFREEDLRARLAESLYRNLNK